MYFVPLSPYFFLQNYNCPAQFPSLCQANENLFLQSNHDSSNSPRMNESHCQSTLSPIILKEAPSQGQKQLKIQKKGKTEMEDEDYRPDASSNKKKSSMKQIENRNIIPNVIRLIISFIQKKGKSERIVKKLIEKWESPSICSLKRFYLYQNMIKNKLNSYVNEETIRLLVQPHDDLMDIYEESEQRFYNKITRVLINYFIRDDFYSFVITSKRMEQQKKNLHLIALRNIRDKIRALMAPK